MTRPKVVTMPDGSQFLARHEGDEVLVDWRADESHSWTPCELLGGWDVEERER